MIIQNIVGSLSSRYLPRDIDIKAIQTKQEYLSDSIIPSDVLAFSGQGATLQTTNGDLIDLSSMTVNCILGQNDPWVNANVVAYLLSGRPSFLTTRIGSDFYYKVARRILEVTKMNNAVINHRQCNGTDVTELAVLAAYIHRKEGQTTLVSFDNSYHGQGLTAYLMSGLQRTHSFLVNESPVVFLPQPSNATTLDDSEELSEKDQQTLSKLDSISSSVFAVIIEPIQVNNAVNMSTKRFMEKLKEICEKRSIALIFDEVQTGFGWLGTMTAAERYGVYPNLLALSKAVTAGNGPLSVLISDSLYRDIPDGTGAKTNGADIRSLVSSYAVMDRLMGMPKSSIPEDLPTDLAMELQNGLLFYFPHKEQLLQQHLEDVLQFSHGMIQTLKGTGFIRGMEIVDKDGNYDEHKTKDIQLALLENGVLLRHSKHTLICKPPIVITEEEMDEGFDRIKRVLKKFI